MPSLPDASQAMTRLRPLRNLRSREAAARGRSYRDAGVGWGRFAGAVATWLAALAILVQAVVPDFAMAARYGDRQKAGVAVALQSIVPDREAASLRYSGCAPATDEQPPADGHRHEELCAFCIVQNLHGAPAGGGIGLPVPIRYREAVAGDRPGVHPPRLFLAASRPRAPPAAGRA